MRWIRRRNEMRWDEETEYEMNKKKKWDEMRWDEEREYEMNKKKKWDEMRWRDRIWDE